MSRGGLTHGRQRLPVESCHSLSAWGWYTAAQMWTQTEDVEGKISWDGDDRRAVIRFTRNGAEHTQQIALTQTPCNYGGARSWFVCPHCGRRVGKVYLPCTAYTNGERVTTWLCRTCYGLTYEQRRCRDLYWPLLHRAERIAERWFGEVEQDKIWKQPGQHSKTFARRFAQWENVREQADRYVVASLGKLLPRLRM